MMDPVTSEQPLSAVDPSKVTPDQVAKIRKDLDVVQSNMSVFSEMLSEMNPENDSPSDDELLEELFTTCTEMQRRITELLCNIASEELTGEMLIINDELNNLFLRYGRYRKNQEKNLQKQPAEPSLIDFGAADVSRVLGGLKLEKGNDNDGADFDSLAKSRSGKGAEAKPPIPEGISEDEILMGHKPSDFDEMEAWLRENPGAAGAYASGTTEASLTSSEFDKFLSERASGGTKTDNTFKSEKR